MKAPKYYISSLGNIGRLPPLPSTNSDSIISQAFQTFAMEIDEDVIVVDDVDDTVPPEVQKRPEPGPSRESRPVATGIRSALRRRNTPPSYAAQMDDSSPERDGVRKTRSSTYRSIGSRSFQPKLKLKLSEKAASQAPGMSFLGPYDRELDSDDEDLVFEEQFVLRMPPGEDCERLRKMVASREVGNDVWFKFKGERACCSGPTAAG